MAPIFWTNTVDWLKEPAFYQAVALPLVISLVCLWLYLRQPLRLKAGPALAVWALSTVLSIFTAYWSELGLHAIAWAAVAFNFLVLLTRSSFWVVYPATYFSLLTVDLVLARHQPSYPLGIGGAGFQDMLFLAPTFVLIVTWLLSLLSETQLKRPALPPHWMTRLRAF